MTCLGGHMFAGSMCSCGDEPVIEPRPASGSDRTPDSIERELTALAAQLDRVKSEERRLYAARLVAWQEARRLGLSWRAIAAASGGMDHAQIAKTVGKAAAPPHEVNGLREGTD